MDPATISAIIGLVLTTIQAATQAGKSLREALADSFEDAARKLRAGAINIDAAVEKARKDQARIERLSKRIK